MAAPEDWRVIRFILNDATVDAKAVPAMATLDYLRHHARLTGVKYACREGDCGSCVVLVGEPTDCGIHYRPATSCLLPLGAVASCHVVTIEGLNLADLTPVQQCFVDHGASQCGFCTPGFVVSLVGFMIETATWNEDAAIEAIAGNICRCTGYASIRRAVAAIVSLLEARVDPREDRIPALVREGFLPPYFTEIRTQLLATVSDRPETWPGSNQTVVGGATDLYVQRANDITDADIFLAPRAETPAIRSDGHHVYISGSATAHDLKSSVDLRSVLPSIGHAMRLMGSLPIRVQATVAGNIVNASPIGDMTITLLALDSELSLRAGDQRRVIALCDFFRAYKEVDLEPGELVEWVRFPVAGPDRLFNFEKVSKRTHLDIASVNTAMVVHMDSDRIDRACISAGGVAPTPIQLKRTGAFLVGRQATAATATEAAEIARTEIQPISDVRGSAEYKRLLLGQLLLAHFNVLFAVEPDFRIGEAR